MGISGSVVVGITDDEAALGTDNGFIYDGSTFTELDDPMGMGYTSLAGISNGIVVGKYIDSTGVIHGFIATPIPEPFSLGPVCFVFLALTRRKRAS